MSSAYTLVQKQAEDESLWFIAEIITEAHLQEALRQLHAAVEHDYAIPAPSISEAELVGVIAARLGGHRKWLEEVNGDESSDIGAAWEMFRALRALGVLTGVKGE